MGGAGRRHLLLGRLMVTYLVERYWPGVTRADAAAAEERVRIAAEGTQAGAERVRFVRSTLVPADETVFYFYDAPSAEAVIAASERADVPVDRIRECTDLDEPER